jgi:hypothetical protein
MEILCSNNDADEYTNAQEHTLGVRAYELS